MNQGTDLITTPGGFLAWPISEDEGDEAWTPPEADPTPRLGVVLVNYKGTADTLECLESLLRSDIPLRVAVVENASGDDSEQLIRDWAAGKTLYAAPEGPLGALSSPPLDKPVPIEVIDGDEALRHAPGERTLSLILSDSNLGFAGGNNLGIRYLLKDPNIEAVWLLNNDTVVEPAAARALLFTIRADATQGMIGTVIRYYHAPDKVQALGGMTFNALTGATAGIHGNKPFKSPWDSRAAARQAACVLGASLTVTRRFVETVGLMSDAYFLYYEEMDWARRNASRFSIGFARGSVVYHKHGNSIGSSTKKGGRSAQSEYWLLRARLLFYRKYHPLLLPVIWLQGAALTARRALRRQPKSVKAMTRALFFRPL
ncbi:glycosyltransferase family 2 protein [Sandaracinobacter neustonicus]|uniref:Glycosyltransferase family 2 protein n=1 Tax=Sandaracinobacter neustonicus TaxID=1715348 RepID=A0A501XDL6_9SPHN|nr:glycosyltransferase family 2 protein [Sandaracinobacter neustonicus]TPE58586.1 glycosyltransferase family 2 protein [Sandaracinobacter neustonicus]